MEKTALLNIIGNFPGKRIAVIGDLMLDVYLWGRVTRISPEAPVPIVRINRVTNCLGGAANVMRNLVTLGGSALAFGMTGDDADGREICTQLANYGIDAATVAVDPTRRTTNKQRVIAGTQQLLRVDYEDTNAASEKIRDRLTRQVLELVEKRAVDAVVFEDYGKGMLDTEILRRIVPAANAHNIITALDPKPGAMHPIEGLTVIKPNRKEAVTMAALTDYEAGEEPPLDLVARRILELWKPKYLLISLASEGMALYESNGKRIRIPTRAREVYDVSGAGDTVVAAFTLALASGATPRQAAELGNYAAGIVVGKVGTVTVSAEELAGELK